MHGRNFSVRTDESKLEEIDGIAKAQNRSRNFVVNEAIDRYLTAERDWQARVMAGLAAAEADNFATDAEVTTVFKRLEGSSK